MPESSVLSANARVIPPMRWRSIAIFTALALAVSWTLQIVAVQLWGLNSSMTAMMLMAVMWSPSVIALAFIVLDPTARAGLLWKVGRVAYLPLGVFIPVVIGFVILAILIGGGLATSGWFAFEGRGVTIGGGPWVLGEGFQGWPLYLGNVAATAVVFSVITLGVTTGEEFAWRGFLQGHLIRRTGMTRGLLILALIWWAWHVPVLLAGYNYPDYPVLGTFVLFPLQILGLTFLFGWLTIRSGSFWPAALGHAALNSIQEGVIGNLQLGVPGLYLDILRIALGLVVGLACWVSLRRDAPPEAGGSGSGGKA